MKIYNIISLGILAATLSIGSVTLANAQKTTNTFNAEISEISEISKNLSTVSLDKLFSEKQYIDENGDVQLIQENNITYDMENIVKKYHLEKKDALNNTYTSIYDNLSDEYSYCIPIKNNNDIIGMAQLNIGKPIDEVKKILDEMTFKSESTKENILNQSKIRQGKWYISSIKKYENNNPLLTIEEINNILASENISDIVDIKYISAGDFATEAICIKTTANEFIMPLDANSYLINIDNGELYTLSELYDSLPN